MLIIFPDFYGGQTVQYTQVPTAVSPQFTCVVAAAELLTQYVGTEYTVNTGDQPGCCGHQPPSAQAAT